MTPIRLVTKFIVSLVHPTKEKCCRLWHPGKYIVLVVYLFSKLPLVTKRLNKIGILRTMFVKMSFDHSSHHRSGLGSSSESRREEPQSPWSTR